MFLPPCQVPIKSLCVRHPCHLTCSLHRPIIITTQSPRAAIRLSSPSFVFPQSAFLTTPVIPSTPTHWWRRCTITTYTPYHLNSSPTCINVVSPSTQPVFISSLHVSCAPSFTSMSIQLCLVLDTSQVIINPFNLSTLTRKSSSPTQA